MLLDQAEPYNLETNNCRHYTDRMQAALELRSLNAFKVIVATSAGDAMGRLQGVHAMTGVVIAKDLPGEHYVYVESQTGQVFYESEIVGYLTDNMGILDPVTIDFGRSRNCSSVQSK